jgi:CheY-like chemotaxis protein
VSAPLRALIVHPEPAVAVQVRAVAEALGYEVTILPDGERAIDRFVQEPFDVVVVEYFLPGRDGVTTVESIRWAPHGRQMRAVLLAESEPEIAPLTALGARIDAVDTIVGTPSREALHRALSRAQTPTGQLPTSPATRSPAVPLTFDDETVVPNAAPLTGATAAPSKIMATRFDDESTVQGSAGVARAMLGALPHGSFSQSVEIPALLKSTPDAAPLTDEELRRSSSGAILVPRSPSEAEDGTRVARPGASEDKATNEYTARPSAAPKGGEWRRDAGTLAEARKVREQEEASANTQGLQLNGRFEDTPFPALLARLGEARTSGGLICKQEGSSRRETTNGDAPTKIVYFRSGLPTHVRSNLLDECLGQLLLRKKRIGRATLEESIRRTQAGDGLQGEILIDMGALSPIEVSETLAAQASEKLYDLFGWRQGSFRMASNVDAPRDQMTIELGLPEIVYEGVCAAMPATLLLDLLTPHLEHFVVPDAARLARFARVRLPPELRPVLARIDGRAPLRVVLGAGSRPGAVAQMVYALECLQAVQFEDQPRGRGAPREESDLRVQPTRGLVSARVQPGASWDEDATSKERPHVVASLPQKPSFEEVATAREKAVRDKPVRPASRRKGLAVPMDDEPHETRERPVLPDISAPHRGVVPSTNIVPTPDVSAAHRTAEPPASAVMAAPTAPAPASVPPAELDQKVDRLFEAERHFRRGSRALERERWDEALSAFVRAHEIVPTEGEFLAYVGWSRFSIPTDDAGSRELALTELAQAADLSPGLYVTHLLHARVLTKLRRDGEAKRAYERVLVLEPNNEEAQTALARISRPPG